MPRSPSRDSEPLARLVTSGPEGLDDREALQVAAGLTAAQAAVLFGEFGSLAEVLSASPAALGRGVSARQAARLLLLKDVARRLLAAPLRRRTPLTSWDDVAGYLRGVLAGRRREQLRGLFLDARNRLLRDEVLGEGTFDHVPIYPREILRRALELDAAGVVLAHNHPSGGPAPSGAVVAATQQVIAAGRPLRISLHDHFLVADDQVVSLRALGLL